jgi:hypothetical protein
VGATDSEQIHLSRRRFLGWGATVLTAAAVPGATLLLTDAAAAAAASPYAMASWAGLLQRTVQVSVTGGPSMALQVVKVTNAAVATSTKMTGDSFIVSFKAPTALSSKNYNVTAPGLGSFPLFMDGSGGMARAVINRRVPA